MKLRTLLCIFLGGLVVVGAALWTLRATDRTLATSSQRTPSSDRATPGKLPRPAVLDTAATSAGGTPKVTANTPSGNIPITPKVAPVQRTPAVKQSRTVMAPSVAGSNPQDPAFITQTERAWHPGEDAVASITTADGHTVVGLHPNQVNSFPRVSVQPQETVNVTVAWPQGAPGETVVAAVEDGGYLGSKQRVLKLTLDDQRQVRFPFTVSQETGVFRVTLRKGAEAKTLQLWAGPELALATARNQK